MSHIHDGPLAHYNSLTDPNLAGFFGNTRMRRHLRKNGLVNRRGDIVTENQYRLNMARKEHKRHVKDLLAQAIVHKTLDLERYRQVEIKKKLEEIAKIEMVRRVRATRGRKGDEEVLPYLTPRSMSRPQSERPSVSSNGRRRPKSAPAPPRERHQSNKSGYTDPYDDVIYVDDEGRPVSPPPPSDRPSFKESLREVRSDNIDTRHFYALDSEALQQYALKLSKAERGRDGASSPYLLSQIPQPPKQTRARSARSSPRRSARMSSRPQSSTKKPGVRGALMLHRQEPAMMHQGEVQTLCEITMKYHGPNLTLPRDQFDPTQEVSIEQQHCGGNTLPVFKERLQAGSTFSFISRRHRGYPFSLTLYIDGRVDCRISTCCEYKHVVGVKLGGKMGHFSLSAITGATPCYKCKLSCQAPPRSLKLKKSSKSGKKKPVNTEEEVTVEGTPRTPITPKTQEEPEVAGKSDDDNYDDDFEEEDTKEDKYEEDFEDEDKEKRHIIGLRVDESRVNGKTVSVDVAEKEKEEQREGTLPAHRRIEGYSSEDEDAEGPKRESIEVTAVVHSQKKEEASQLRVYESFTSSSSSSDDESPRPKTPVKQTVVPVSPAKNEAISARSDVSAVPKSDRTDRSTASSGSLTTETETTMDSGRKPQVVRKKRSSSSSSSSTLTSDSEDEKYQRKKRNERLKRENELKSDEQRRQEAEERENKRKIDLEIEEKKRQTAEEERNRRFELQRQQSQERLKAMEDRRKQIELERQEKNAEQMRAKEEDLKKRQAEEDRIKRDYEKQLSFIQSQRDSETTMSVTDTTVSDEPKVKEEKRKSSSSSSSSSESESEDEKKGTRFEAAVASVKEPEPVKVEEKEISSSSPSESKPEPKEPEEESKVIEEKKDVRRSSSSSSGSSTSSSSGGEYMVVKSAATKTEEKVISSQKPEKEASSSSSSTESDDDNKKVETPKQEVVEKKTTKSSSSSSGSSSSDSESDSEDEKKPERVPSPQQTPSQPIETKVTETVSETVSKEKEAESEDSSSDSSSSSDSDSSDSEDENKKTGSKGVTSESDADNMHGGHDPDNVAKESQVSRLSQSKPRPPQKHYGSILPMIKGSNEVDLNGVKLDDTQLNEVGNYIAEEESIKSVTLRNAGMDDDEFRIISRSLQQTKSCPNLLNFSLNQLTVASMTDLASAVKSNPAVSVLILNGNPIGDQGCKKVLDALTKTKDPFPFLRRASGYLTPAEARKQEMTDMKEEETKVEAQGGSNIKELYLGDCNLTNDGIEEVSKFLASNTTLQSLNLSGNTSGITSSGWMRLGEALSKNKTLKSLSLDYTDLGDDGFECLAKGLRTNTGLTCLEMESAGLTEKGGQLLKELLKSNTSILEITAMPGNDISDDMMEEIRKYLALNNTATYN